MFNIIIAVVAVHFSEFDGFEDSREMSVNALSFSIHHSNHLNFYLLLSL